MLATTKTTTTTVLRVATPTTKAALGGRRRQRINTTTAAAATHRRRVMANASGNTYKLLTLEYVDDMLEKRGPHREEHLAGAQRGFDAGEIVMAGALTDPVDAGVFVFKNVSEERVKAFAEADAYVRAGLVPKYTIRNWMVVVGGDD